MKPIIYLTIIKYWHNLVFIHFTQFVFSATLPYYTWTDYIMGLAISWNLIVDIMFFYLRLATVDCSCARNFMLALLNSRSAVSKRLGWNADSYVYEILRVWTRSTWDLSTRYERLLQWMLRVVMRVDVRSGTSCSTPPLEENQRPITWKQNHNTL